MQNRDWSDITKFSFTHWKEREKHDHISKNIIQFI